MMKNLLMILSCLLISISTIQAQDITVSGIVVDESGLGVIGATVVQKGTNNGVITGIDGDFSIEAPHGSTLVFSMLGMIPVEMKATADMKIVMQTAENILDDVMVVAYGTANKNTFTGAASVVNNKELNNRVVANVSKAVDGLVTGVTTTTGNGQPGSGAKIQVRGIGSMNASNDPLYVVDGMPYSGPINAINPNDIESLTILKDASAGALYGARGANGVVLISTKSGKSGALNINFKSTWGWSKRGLQNYDMVDERGYMEFAYQNFRTKGISEGYTGDALHNYVVGQISNNTAPNRVTGMNEQYNPFNVPMKELFDANGKVVSGATLKYSDDWMKAALADNPLRQEYVLDVSGGSEKTQYLVSAGYLNEEGLLANTKFERITARMKVNSKVRNWMQLNASTNAAFGNSNYSISTVDGSTTASSNVFYSAMLIAPIYPLYERDSQGNLILTQSGEKQYDYGVNRASGAQQNFNAVGLLYDDQYKQQEDVFSARGNAILGDLTSGPLQGLALNLGVGVDLVNGREMRYYNPYTGNAIPEKGRVRKYSTRRLEYTLNQLLSYKRTFGVHSLDVLVGHEYYTMQYDYMRGAKTGYPYGGNYELGIGSTIADLTSYQDNYKIDSWLSRANYNYADRYYFSASLRRDGSSIFAKDNRWGTFWSLGGNWRISEEDFIKNAELSWINNLALRASYGLQGNDAIYLNGTSSRNYYGWDAQFDMTYPNGNNSGGLLSQVKNEELTWEKNHNLNIGLSARLFNIFDLELEYYNKKTTDLLMYYPLPVSGGIDGYNKNIGKMRNQGFEISLGAQIIRSSDFDWRMTVMANTIKNKVLGLTGRGEDETLISGNRISQVGLPYRSFYGVKSAGVDIETGNPLYWVAKDANGNAIEPYTTSDSNLAQSRGRVVLGDYFPSLFGSINNQFRYRDFDLSFLLTYSIGGKIYDNVYQTLMTSPYIGNTRHSDILQAWENPGDVTNVAKVDINRSNIFTDQYLFDASYLAIKNISFGYTLPSNLLNKIDVKSVRLTFSVDNLATFTKLKGMNPQYSLSGTNEFSYIPTKTFTFGLDIKF